MQVKDSSEYGWLVIERAEYARMLEHGNAGPGTPCHPDRPGFWAMTYNPDTGATELWTGLELIDDTTTA